MALDPHFLLFEWLFVKGNLRSGQLKLVRRFTDAARQTRQTFRDQVVFGPISCSRRSRRPEFIQFFFLIHQNSQKWAACLLHPVVTVLGPRPLGDVSASSSRVVLHQVTLESRDVRRSGQPLVRQLLMGEGKSAVIAPLLSLLLAEELVLQARTKRKCVGRYEDVLISRFKLKTKK